MVTAVENPLVGYASGLLVSDQLTWDLTARLECIKEGS